MNYCKKLLYGSVQISITHHYDHKDSVLGFASWNDSNLSHLFCTLDFCTVFFLYTVFYQLKLTKVYQEPYKANKPFVRAKSNLIRF